MKQFTFRAILVAFALAIGSSGLKAQEPTIIYERGSLTAWSDADLTEWVSSNSNKGTLAVSESGLKVTIPASGKWDTYTKSISTKENSKLTLTAVWNPGEATGTANSTNAFLAFGDVSFAFYGSSWKTNATIGSETTELSGVGKVRSADYTISVAIDKAKGTVNYTFSNGTTSVEGSGSTSSDFSTIQFGIGGRIPGWENTNTIKSITITEEEQTVQTADYTINYLFDGTNIKTVSASTVIGNTVYAESPLVVDDQKYYAADGQAISMEIVDGTNVLDVNLRKAYEYSYSVVSNLGTTIAMGVGTEEEVVISPYPRYVNNGGSLYTKAATDKQYNVSFVPTGDNYVETLNYSDANIGNVVFFSEGEDISGATKTNAGNNMKIRSSNAACGYATTDIDLVSLTPGVYNVHTALYSNSSGGLTLTFTYGDKTLTHVVSSSNNLATQSAEITINTTCNFTWNASGDSKNGLDYIYIQKLADLASVSSAGFATYSPTKNVVVPAEDVAEVYTASVSGETVNLTAVPAGTALLAGTGYVVKAPEGSVRFDLTSGEASAIEGNDLKVAGEGGVEATEASAYYVLAKRNNGQVGFNLVASGVVIPQGKAYLDLGAMSAKPAFIGIDGSTTAIQTLPTADADDAFYSLQGVKTAKPAKGIYINNGKKVVVKH